VKEPRSKLIAIRIKPELFELITKDAETNKSTVSGIMRRRLAEHYVKQ
jgi:hypothetical protein